MRSCIICSVYSVHCGAGRCELARLCAGLAERLATRSGRRGLGGRSGSSRSSCTGARCGGGGRGRGLLAGHNRKRARCRGCGIESEQMAGEIKSTWRVDGERRSAAGVMVVESGFGRSCGHSQQRERERESCNQMCGGLWLKTMTQIRYEAQGALSKPVFALLLSEGKCLLPL